MTYSDAAFYLVALQTNLIAGLTEVTRPREVVEAIDVILTLLEQHQPKDGGVLPWRPPMTAIQMILTTDPEDRCATCQHRAKHHTAGRCRARRCGCGQFVKAAAEPPGSA